MTTINFLLLLLLLLAPRWSSAFSLPTSGRNSIHFGDSWNVITLGDLHMEEDMTSHEQARQDCLRALKDYPVMGTNSEGGERAPLTQEYFQALEESPAGELTTEELQLLLNTRQHPCKLEYCQSHLVSLGDLGRGNKKTRHQPGDAGTSQSFQDAKAYLDGFQIDYDLVTGNHDLEGLDEFETDEVNLKAWMDCFHRKQPYFHRYLGETTLLLGLSTVQFREAPYSSHEVHVDDAQLEWFQQMVESHKAYKILVFSHAPILGSGLRVLQNVHITSGCAWLNHCSEHNRNRFLEIVQANPQIKLWASGHFHLSHELPDTLTQVGACAFVQVGVMGLKSTRDGRRQTRFFRGCGPESIEIYSINHHKRIPCGINDGESKAQVRLDATLDLQSGRLIYEQEPQETNGETTPITATTEKWFQAYLPQEEDGCYLGDVDGSIDGDKVCWWHMADGKVLGLHQGQLVEYDAQTLAPLGVVVLEEQLHNREVLVVQNKTTLVLVDDNTQDVEVVHPNPDGSYWRKLSRSKVIRLEEQAREEVAKRWLDQQKQQTQTQEDAK